jgi:hypothetical protein
MTTFRVLTITALIIILGGCASGAKKENMDFLSTEKQYSYDDALKNDVGLSSVSGGEDTNPLWTSEISNEDFTGAVRMSLKSQGLLSPKGRYTLKVNLIKVDQPLFGLDLTVTTHVKYILTDSKNNTVLVDETVDAPYTATFSDSMIAMTRLQLANEGSGKLNIQGLLEKLSALKIDANEISLAK